MTQPVPKSFGTVNVFVDTITGTDAQVYVLDNNSQPIVGPATIPVGVIKMTTPPLKVGDVVENMTNGARAVVAWLNPADPTQWSYAAGGQPRESAVGWKKIGTFTPS